MNSSKPKNILIVNVHSTMNAGDAGLLWLNLQQLEKVFPKANFAALVNYPDEPYLKSFPALKVLPSPFDLVNAGPEVADWKKIVKLGWGCFLLLLAIAFPEEWLVKNPSHWLQIALAYRTADAVVAVSGVQLVSLGKFSWPLIVSSVAIILAHYYRKPLYVMPQSLGPFRWRWERWLVRQLYARARLVFLRDSISLQLAKDIGLPESKVKFAYDPGFALPAASSERALEIMSGYGYSPDKRSLGITVIARLSKAFDQGRLVNYYTTLAKVLVRFTKTVNAKVYIFDQVTGPTPKENDGVAAETLLNLMGEDHTNITHVNCQLTPMELKACYRLMDLFLASRLHSGIFAMGSGVPTIFIGYNPKTKGFLEAVGLEQLLLDLNYLEEQELWELLYCSWEDRQEITEKTLAVVRDCQKDYERVSEWISEDFFDARKS